MTYKGKSTWPPAPRKTLEHYAAELAIKTAKPRRPRNVPEKQWDDDVDLVNEDGTPYTG